MIDVCTVIYRNYELLDFQIKHWNWLEGDHNLVVVDATPSFWRKQVEYPVIQKECKGSDGESHGAALDFAVSKTTTSIIGLCDSDFFWLKPNIIKYVEELFSTGIRCVGAELWYRDFGAVNQMYPERAGYLAPCIFGMFVDRDLALSETFVVTRAEGAKSYETGWRLRKKIIDEKIPIHVFRAFVYTNQSDAEVTFFGETNSPVGVHFVKGSNDYFERDELFHILGLDSHFQKDQS